MAPQAGRTRLARVHRNEHGHTPQWTCTVLQKNGLMSRIIASDPDGNSFRGRIGSHVELVFVLMGDSESVPLVKLERRINFHDG